MITANPAIGLVLEEYNIRCTSCSAGSCRLRDIIEIHDLSELDEYTMFKQIADILFPGHIIEIPKLPRKKKGLYSKNRFSPPMQQLVNEHTTIKMVLGAIPKLLSSAEKDIDAAHDVLMGVLDFIRNFADKYHHVKEEDILFKFFDEKAGSINSMCEEHEIGRMHIRKASEALKNGDIKTLLDSMFAYAELLVEHIRKEDEILFPWINKMLTDNQVGILFSRFAEVESRFGEETRKLVMFAQSIEQSNNK